MTKNKDWKYKTSIEKRLAESLISLSKHISTLAETAKDLPQFRSLISRLAKSPEWREVAWTEAAKMVQGVTAQNSKTWREAARKSRRARMINATLRQELSNNVAFISLVRSNSKVILSLPSHVAEEVTKKASEGFIQGIRSDKLFKEIKAAAPGIAISKAQLIARTETAKAQAAVTQIRSEQLGIDWFIWRTSEDQRVRHSHKELDGVLVRFSDLPAPEVLFPTRNKDGTISRSTLGHYGPGDCPNCRCYAEPVIDQEDIKFPRLVYSGGKIQKMTRKQWLAVAA